MESYFCQKDLTKNPDFNNIVDYEDFPFDTKLTYFTGKSRGFLCYPRGEVMQHFVKGENIGLVVARECVDDWKYVFVTNKISSLNLTGSAQKFGAGFVFPLYLYEEFRSDQKSDIIRVIKTANLSKTITDELQAKTGLAFIKQNTEIADFDTFSNNVYVYEETENTIKLFDYIYAVLHSPAYREKYKEFLKIDFPRIPFPDDTEQYFTLATFGEKLRKLHLMEDVTIPQNIANFPIAGTNEVEKPEYQNGKVFINSAQFFDNVPPVAWNFYIGGYPPAQKWLKDRKGRTLGYDEIRHYQKIIAVLCETERIMREIDVVLQYSL